MNEVLFALALVGCYQEQAPLIELVGPDAKKDAYATLLDSKTDRESSSDGRFVLLISKQVRCLVDLRVFGIRWPSATSKQIDFLKALPSGDPSTLTSLPSNTRSALLDVVNRSGFIGLSSQVAQQPDTTAQAVPELRGDLRLQDGRTLSISIRPGDVSLRPSTSVQPTRRRAKISLRNVNIRPHDAQAQLDQLSQSLSLLTQFAEDLKLESDRLWEAEAWRRSSGFQVLEGWDRKSPIPFSSLPLAHQRTLLDSMGGQFSLFGFTSSEQAARELSRAVVSPSTVGVTLIVEMPGPDGIPNQFLLRPNG